MLGGPVGAGIGAAIGGVAGLIGGLMKKDPGWKQIMGRVGHDYGAAFMEGFEGISEELAKQIEEDAKKIFKGDWQAAEIYNIGAIMEDTGGVDTSNLDAWSGKMTDIFSMLETGKFTMAQATTAFDKGFSQIAQAVLDADQIASPAFLNMIQLTRQFGMESKAVAEFISGQFTRAMTAWAAIAAPLVTMTSGIAEARQELIDFNKELEGSGKYDPATGKYSELGVEDQQRLDEINKKLKTIKETVADVTKDFEAFNAELAKAGKYDPATGKYTGLGIGDQKQLDDLNKRMETAKKNTADVSKEAERLGRLLMAAFNGAVKSGMDFFEVMDALGPNLDTLIKLYKDLGITSDNAALSALMHFQELYGKNKELVDGVRALNDMTLALSNLGALSAETLADLEAQGLSMYEQMRTAGFTQTETLMAMLPWLKNVFDAHVKLGIPIDANTQKLIDEANALGLLEDNDPTSILKQGFRDLIQAVTDLTNALLGIPPKVNSEVNVHTNYTSSGKPVDPNDPDPNDPDPIPQAYGGSYWVTQPTMFMAGEAGPEQVLFSGANQKLSGRWGGGSAGVDEDTSAASTAPSASFTFNIQALDPLGIKKVVEEEIAPLLVSVYRRNVSGLRTDTRRELLE
jgi:chaperonin cofactor prefoldin